MTQDFHSLGENDPSWREPRPDDENDPGGSADEEADALVDSFGSTSDETPSGERPSSPSGGEPV
jgi:hypothetical protein